LVFLILTGLMLAGGIVPYRPGVTIGSEPRRLLVGALEAMWWLGAAWLAAGFLRAFVVLGRQPRESKLVQDLLAALHRVGPDDQRKANEVPRSAAPWIADWDRYFCRSRRSACRVFNLTSHKTSDVVASR
jgi:hypothetical protein